MGRQSERLSAVAVSSERCQCAGVHFSDKLPQHTGTEVRSGALQRCSSPQLRLHEALGVAGPGGVAVHPRQELPRRAGRPRVGAELHQHPGDLLELHGARGGAAPRPLLSREVGASCVSVEGNSKCGSVLLGMAGDSGWLGEGDGFREERGPAGTANSAAAPVGHASLQAFNRAFLTAIQFYKCTGSRPRPSLALQAHRQAGSSGSSGGSPMTSQLFKSFGKDKVSGHSQLKASVQRGIRGAPPSAAPPPAATTLVLSTAPVCPCVQPRYWRTIPGWQRQA